jgi:hypothetical protein
VNVLLYDRLDCPIKNDVELELMKYITGGFLKCELRLDQLTTEQFRLFSSSIPGAISHRQNFNPNFSTQQSEGFTTIKSITELIQKFLDFKDSNKQEEMFKLLNHYIIPEDEVLDYQLQKLLNDMNVMVKRMLGQLNHINYVNIYIFNGHSLERVTNLYELYTNMPIVAAQHDIVDTRTVIKYR